VLLIWSVLPEPKFTHHVHAKGMVAPQENPQKVTCYLVRLKAVSITLQNLDTYAGWTAGSLRG
jgi:hypothetical protein